MICSRAEDELTLEILAPKPNLQDSDSPEPGVNFEGHEVENGVVPNVNLGTIEVSSDDEESEGCKLRPIQVTSEDEKNDPDMNPGSAISPAMAVQECKVFGECKCTPLHLNGRYPRCIPSALAILVTLLSRIPPFLPLKAMLHMDPSVVTELVRTHYEVQERRATSLPQLMQRELFYRSAVAEATKAQNVVQELRDHCIRHQLVYPHGRLLQLLYNICFVRVPLLDNLTKIETTLRRRISSLNKEQLRASIFDEILSTVCTRASPLVFILTYFRFLDTISPSTLLNSTISNVLNRTAG